MNRDRLSAIAHADHSVAAPLSDESVDNLVRRVAGVDAFRRSGRS
jgi:hypothetical protein